MVNALKVPTRIVVAAMAAAGLLAILLSNALFSASAAAECDSADFTVDGVFDTEGYLACLNGTDPNAPTGGGGLPETGSNTLQLVGLGLALLAIGVAAVVLARRQRRGQLA